MLLTEFDEKKYRWTLLEDGREEGRVEGRIETINVLSDVKNGIISQEAGANMLGVTKEKIDELLK